MQQALSGSCGLSGTRRQIAWALAMGFSVAVGIVLVARFHVPLPARIAAVAVPVFCGLAYARQLILDLRKMDELQLRIYLEAAALACLGVFLAGVIYPVAQYAGFIGPIQPYYIVFLLTGLWMFGFLNAMRRYR